MIPVLVGLGLAIGGAAIASSGKSDGEWITESATRVTPESDDGYDAQKRYTWSYKLQRWVEKDDPLNGPCSEETSTRVIDESEVPDVVRKKINAQERSNHDNEIINAIKKLGDLYKVGILTDEEFTAKKKELLGRL